MKIKTVSLIVPCYNESDVISEFYNRSRTIAEKYTDYNFEFLFINDGSIDDTTIKLNILAERDPRVRVLHFSRNQGHQTALTAGMDFAKGDVVITIDADLQDPPELIPAMLEKIDQGYAIVHAQRQRRAGETWFKRTTAWLFYRIMKIFINNEFPEDCGDFRAFTQPVLRTVNEFRERHRYLRGIFSVVGFQQCYLPYNRDARFAGKTKYNIVKMVRLAVNAVLSFSTLPIKLIIWLSVLLWLMSIGYLFKALFEHYVLKITVPGWTSLIILLIFFTGIILFCLGVIGSYVGKIFEQGQHRPLYWLCDARNIDFFNRANETLTEIRLSEKVLEGGKKSPPQKDDF